MAILHAVPDIVEHRRKPAGVLLCELPRRFRVDVPVQEGGNLEDGVERLVEAEVSISFSVLGRRAPACARSGARPCPPDSAGASTLPGQELPDHVRAPRHEIAVIVRQVPVDAGHDGVLRKIAVQAERHLPEEEEPELIDAVRLRHLEGVDHVAQAIWTSSGPRPSTSRGRRRASAAEDPPP